MEKPKLQPASEKLEPVVLERDRPVMHRPLDQEPFEKGGRTTGPEATRYGDWEKNGRAVDF